MYANNETGAIQPLSEIGAIARKRGIPFTPTPSSCWQAPREGRRTGVDLLSLSAHKFYGPKGVGLLYVRRGTPISWQQLGASGKRPRGGTENVPSIAGMGAALALAERDRAAYARDCQQLRDQLFAEIEETRRRVPLTSGAGWHRLPNNLNITIDGVQGETVLLNLDIAGVAASAGSACTTGNSEPSHVLRAMGLSDERCGRRPAHRRTLQRRRQMEDAGR